MRANDWPFIVGLVCFIATIIYLGYEMTRDHRPKRQGGLGLLSK